MRFDRLVVLALAFCLASEPATYAGGKGGSSSSSSSGGGSKGSSGGSSSGWGGSSSGTKGGSSSGWGSSSGVKSSPGSSNTPKSSGGSSSGWGGSSSGSPSKSGWGSSSSGSAKTVTTTTPKPGVEPTNVSKKPAAPSFDKVAAADAKKAESRVNYEKSQAPAASYKTPKGETKPIRPKDPETEYLRGRLDESRWTNRSQRETVFYSHYAGPAYPLVVYGDPYHPMFNYWLLSQSLDTMAMWVLCHENAMDRARLRDLYARNAQLEAQVAALRARGVKADPAWVPAGVTDPDLLYNDDYTTAAFNPRPKEVTEYTYADGDGGGDGGAVVVVLVLFFLFVVVLVVLYLMFWHRF